MGSVSLDGRLGTLKPVCSPFRGKILSLYRSVRCDIPGLKTRGNVRAVYQILMSFIIWQLREAYIEITQ